MKIGKLFHLTSLVDEMPGPELFFNSVFSPLCMMRGYSSHWHRHAAIYVMAETSIEPMHVLPPLPGDKATSWFRYMDNFGPRIHNLAFYVDDTKELAARFEAAGVRTTDGGTDGGTLFAHPKDTPGMLEFHTPAPEGFGRMDPRLSPDWAAFSDDYWGRRHALGLVRTSHITVLVNDAAKAAAFYVSVLDAVELEQRASLLRDVEARFVLVGEDTVVELVHPTDPAGALAEELARVGQSPIGVTFLVRDLGDARAHLERNLAPISAVEDHQIALDRARLWGIDMRFTDQPLAGDPRTT